MKMYDYYTLIKIVEKDWAWWLKPVILETQEDCSLRPIQAKKFRRPRILTNGWRW
jgi:hypothetical protein